MKKNKIPILIPPDKKKNSIISTFINGVVISIFLKYTITSINPKYKYLFFLLIEKIIKKKYRIDISKSYFSQRYYFIKGLERKILSTVEKVNNLSSEYISIHNDIFNNLANEKVDYSLYQRKLIDIEYELADIL